MGRIDLLMELERDEQWDWDMPKKEEKTTTSAARKEAENGTQFGHDYHWADICKDHDLYHAARNGDFDGFCRILHTVSTAEQVSIVDILGRVSPAGNTFLHVATRHGNEDIVTYIAAKAPSLVLSRNFKGDTALHVAAKTGDESMVTALLLIHQDLLKPNTEDAENLLRAKNAKGNTALHEALIRGRESVAQHLVQQDPEAALYLNKEGESSLYMAAKAGSVKCVLSILPLLTDEEHVNEQFKNKSPIQAAIKAKNKDVLEAMFDVNSRLIQQRDEEGRTPLHYAASLGCLEEVHYLLDKHPPSATTRSTRTGSFPIHLASIEGFVDIIHLLLQDCPYPDELLDNQGHNILHVAVKNGRYKVISYILNNPTLTRLINMKDKQGNTPLHLASIQAYPKIVSDMTWDKRVDNTLVNNKGMTALDAAEYHFGYSNNQFSERLTWAALKAAATPRYRKPTSRQHRKKLSSSKNYSERVNTLLLVSTLVATVTFAAGFTVPGGYNSSGEDSGIATMLRDKEFHIFVLCDTIAMYTSIIVVVTLIWAQLGDLNLTYNVLSVAVPLLGLALGMMSMAFMAGVFVAVSKLRWLSIAVLIMGITCLAVLIALLVVLCFPLISTRPILRYLSYYPFCLLILATGNWPKD